jgi:hypothetical protein
MIVQEHFVASYGCREVLKLFNVLLSLYRTTAVCGTALYAKWLRWREGGHVDLYITLGEHSITEFENSCHEPFHRFL